jgi:hypothetical protein
MEVLVQHMELAEAEVVVLKVQMELLERVELVELV